ncbi:MAG: hypothetical protein WC593_15215 [Methanoregula sp.]
MRLREYLKLKNVKANRWAETENFPVSMVYAWLGGTTPRIENIIKIKEATQGAVGPEDWGEKP